MVPMPERVDVKQRSGAAGVLDAARGVREPENPGEKVHQICETHDGLHCATLDSMIQAGSGEDNRDKYLH
ncbi:MAG: hypothetical protein QOH33_111 [Paraburkholderia sp.]|nr:hypothetical protein [Paraburkholderia sp.]